MSFSSGSGFNLQTTKKEDVSTRLKTHNLKRAKNETRKLEHEGRKMEERLMELKFAMNREKEERERQGGGFWKSGQQNNGVTTYADEVLAKNKKSLSAGKGKIRILKDEPLDIPERKALPGTVAYIAQKGATTPRDKPRGPKCGQCEERTAAVSCVQCSEDYCAGCFAAFHLRGNLKKHRSVLLSATQRQCFASPRPGPAHPHSSVDFASGEEDVAPYMPNSARKKDRNSPEGASGCYENNIQAGEYNEADQAASFQEALQAWRTGKAAQGPASEPAPGVDRNPTPRGVAYSPVRTPTVNVDSATGTIETEAPIEIKFNTSNLSYADRLLLKKHRRTDVETLFTPREETNNRATRAKPQRTPRESADKRATPRATPRKVKREKSSISMRSIQIEDVDDADFNDDEERVDFRSLFEAIQSTSGEPPDQNDPDTISIVEVQELASGTRIEQTGKYKIQEEGETESWSTDKSNVAENRKVEPKPPMSGKSRRRSGRKSAKSSVDKSTKSLKSDLLPNDNLNSNNKIPANSAQQHDNRLNKESQQSRNDLIQNRENSFDDNSRVLGARLIKIENAVKEDETNLFAGNENRATVSESYFSHKPQKSRPESAQSRPQTAKSRPQTGRNQSRADSRQGSRPLSRANSRAASRIDHPGVLTKGPSDSLREIARMTPTSDHEYKGLNNFLLMGVEGAELGAESGTLATPRGGKQAEKVKVSYQLYNMAPRSWKPDFSIADSVPVDNIENDDAEDDRAQSVMQYAVYSEQMVSEMTDRLVSRFGEIPIDEDSMSDHSSGGAYRSLGEEYRTFTPRSSQNSPSVSGRGTPVQMARFSIKDGPSSARDAPRMSASRARAQTPRASQSRSDARTPRRSKTFHGEVERPVSRAIVMEGTDLSIFDNMGDVSAQNQEDEDTLDQLQWELASNTGRLTGNGKLSRMEIMEDFSDDELNSSLESIRSMSRLGHDKGYDINSKLKGDELEDERDASFCQDDDEDDVRALH